MKTSEFIEAVGHFRSVDEPVNSTINGEKVYQVYFI